MSDDMAVHVLKMRMFSDLKLMQCLICLDMLLSWYCFYENAWPIFWRGFLLFPSGLVYVSRPENVVIQLFMYSEYRSLSCAVKCITQLYRSQCTLQYCTCFNMSRQLPSFALVISSARAYFWGAFAQKAWDLFSQVTFKFQNRLQTLVEVCKLFDFDLLGHLQKLSDFAVDPTTHLFSCGKKIMFNFL